jgi:hypothetical protein
MSILRRLRQRPLRQPDRSRRHKRPLDIERAHGDLEAVSLTPEEVLGGDEQSKLAKIRTVVASPFRLPQSTPAHASASRLVNKLVSSSDCSKMTHKSAHIKRIERKQRRKGRTSRPDVPLEELHRIVHRVTVRHGEL